MTNNKFSWHPSKVINENLGLIDERLSSWHQSEAIKRCQPSVLSGKSARKHGGCLAWQ